MMVGGKKRRKKSAFRKKYPRVYKLGLALGALALAYYIRSLILYASSGGQFFTVYMDTSLGTNIQCRAANSNLTSLPSAVLMDSLAHEKLRLIGGTRHWFHLLERILPFIVPAAKSVWRRGAMLRAASERTGENVEKNSASSSKLYVVFQESLGPTKLDAFGRLTLASILSGGFYDHVVIGYADMHSNGHIGIRGETLRVTGTDKTSTVKNFRKCATLFFHHESTVGESYSEVVYDCTSSQLRSSSSSSQSFRSQSLQIGSGRGFSTRGRVGSAEDWQDHETLTSVPALCVHILMRVRWDATPPKRYMLMGNNSDVYSLLHSSVERTCRLEPLEGANTVPITAKYLFYGGKGSSVVDKFSSLTTGQGGATSTWNQNMGAALTEEEGSDDLELAQQLGYTAAEIAAEKRKRAALLRDDLSRPPYYIPPYSWKKTRSSEGNNKGGAGEGEKSGASIRKEDIRNERFARKVAKWAAIRNRTASDAEGPYHFNYNDPEWNVLYGGDISLDRHKKYDVGSSDQSSWWSWHGASTPSTDYFLPQQPSEEAIVKASSIGGLKPSKVATDVPLTVLFYDRDTTRRLHNVDEVAAALKEGLHMTDIERHAHFPLTYTSERAPRKKPRLGLGSVKESRPGGKLGLKQGGDNMRRKSGGFIAEHSSVKEYEDGSGKVQWQVEVMTHDQHNTYNPHQGHLHDQNTGEDTTIEDSTHRSDATHSQHHPPCTVLRAVREATVLITPHGFNSILLLFQPIKSALVEVFPYGYNKPEIYGMIQAGMRAYRYGQYRSYLHTESHPTSALASLLYHSRMLGSPFVNGVAKHLDIDNDELEAQINAESWYLDPEDRLNVTEMAKEIETRRKEASSEGAEDLFYDSNRWHLFSQDTCTANPVCRHIVRDQAVSLSPAFQRKLVEFLKSHFISNKDIHEDVEAQSFGGIFSTI